MKEKIYTIPVTEAFQTECECPVCVLEHKLEDEYIDYMMGPSLMEPEGRCETNEKGFCQRHFEILYNKQTNRLGLGLVLDTHLVDQTAELKKIFDKRSQDLEEEASMSLMKNLSNKISSKQTNTQKLVDEMVAKLTALENKCAVCDRLNHTMERYFEVIYYLWSKEEDFKRLFSDKKGFCLRHFRNLLEGSKKHLGAKDAASFVKILVGLQLQNLNRIQQEVNWFTKKFDYRYNDAPWGNSKDAIPRSIQKIVGYCNLK